MANLNEYMMPDEAAAYLGVAEIILRRWTQQGELSCMQFGNSDDPRQPELR